MNLTLLSEGKPVSNTTQVLSVIADKAINQIPSATITISESLTGTEFVNSNKPDFEPGKKIEIQADGETIFKGIVIKHGIKVSTTGATLIIECKDEVIKMTAICKNKYFESMNDTQIIEQIIGYYNIENDVDQVSPIIDRVQYNATDWNMILCRADVNGLICMANDGKLSIKKPDFKAAPALTIQYGATIFELEAEINVHNQLASVEAISWNPADQQIETTMADDPGVPEAGNLTSVQLASVSGKEAFQLQHSGNINDQERQQWANAKLLKHRLAKIKGQVTIYGTAGIKPGQMINLKGVGERFEGLLFISGVRHEIDQGTWKSSLTFGDDTRWYAQINNVQQPLAGALLPAIQGLHTGIVTAITNDPDGENRIRVKLPVISTDDEGIWCRLSLPDADIKFRPEIDDEVIVGFINNDPRFAVVLGRLGSSAKPFPW